MLEVPFSTVVVDVNSTSRFGQAARGIEICFGSVENTKILLPGLGGVSIVSAWQAVWSDCQLWAPSCQLRVTNVVNSGA